MSRSIPTQLTADDPMALLAGGIPLSLLCDLADPTGPDSRAIYLDEAPIDLTEVVAPTGLRTPKPAPTRDIVSASA